MVGGQGSNEKGNFTLFLRSSLIPYNDKSSIFPCFLILMSNLVLLCTQISQQRKQWIEWIIWKKFYPQKTIQLTQFFQNIVDRSSKFLIFFIHTQLFSSVILHRKIDSRFNPVTMLSIIGGNLGLWLGVSIIQLWSFLPISRLLPCCFVTKNYKNKIIR